MNRTGGARPGLVRPRTSEHGGSGPRERREARRPGSTPEREPLPTRLRDLPPLPDSSRIALETGMWSLGLAGPAARHPIPEDVLTALEGHARLLSSWNRAINLTAIREPDAVVREHLLDSLAAAALLEDRRVDAFVDLGSGGGFPGLPLAIALPARRALLVESIGKKARFLETVAAALVEAGLPPGPGVVGVAHARAETLAADPRHREGWPAVLARAVAPLSELAELAFPLLSVGGVLVAWKRYPIDEEVAAAAATLDAVGGGPVEVRGVEVPGLEDHLLVVARKVRATPARFPRPPAERRKQA